MGKKRVKTVGRIERVDLPLWKIRNIEAKIDTGAYTSSVHCHRIEEESKAGVPHVRFNLLDPEHQQYNGQLFILPIVDKREVKSSNGETSLRFFIRTELKMFDEIHEIELSLTDRSEMRFPILIGRKFLKNRFLVDVSKKNLSRKKKQK